METEMVWESPPPSGSYDWEEVARTLRANPNKWLRIFETGSIGIVNAARQEDIAALRPIHRQGTPGGGFEVMTRNNRKGPPQVASMYLRYVPNEGGS